MRSQVSPGQKSGLWSQANEWVMEVTVTEVKVKQPTKHAVMSKNCMPRIYGPHLQVSGSSLRCRDQLS